MRKLLVILLLFPVAYFGQLNYEQELQVDSLKQVIKTAKSDTTIINAWKAWDKFIEVSGRDIDFELSEKIIELCTSNLANPLSENEKNFFLKNKASALYRIGARHNHLGNFYKAIDFYTRGLTIAKEMGDKRLTIVPLNNIGAIYSELGNYSKAINYHFQNLTLLEEIGNKEEIASTLNNIGGIYIHTGNYAKAINYFTRNLTQYKEIEDKEGIGFSLINIGIVYIHQKDYDSAIDYFTNSLTIAKEIGDKRLISISSSNIGSIYQDQGNYTKAFDFYFSSLTNAEEIMDKRLIAQCSKDIGVIYMKQADYSSAIEHITYAMSVAQEIDAIVEIQDIAYTLYEAYKTIGKHTKALESYELYISIKDDIESEKNKKEAIRQEYKYEYEKQHILDSLHFKQQQNLSDLSHNAALIKEANQRYTLYSSLVFILLLGSVIFWKYRKKLKEKEAKNRLEQKLHETELQLKKKEKKHLEEQLSIKNERLIDLSIEITRKYDYSKQMLEKLKKIKRESKPEQHPEIIEAISYNVAHIAIDKNLKRFQDILQETNLTFFKILKEKFPKLTQTDLELCAYIRLNLSNKEIASIRCINVESAKVSRYRIRQKLGLDSKDDIVEVLKYFSMDEEFGANNKVIDKIATQ